MKYPHILLAVMEERWAIEQAKLQVMLDFISDQSAGIKYDAEELAARLSQKADKEIARREGQIAILPLRGVIANRMSLMGDISGGTSSEGFGKAFQAALRDDGVKAIVMDVDSPGGAVSGTAELSDMIYAARGTKPIIAHVNSRMSSAAYWIGSAADEIVVTPTGAVGSIGVLGIHEDVSGAMEKLGVKKTIISAGKYKADGNSFEPLGDETRARIQARVDAAYDMFVQAVGRNRGVSAAAVIGGFGQGDTVDAMPAVELGMADRVATLEETLNRFGASQFAPRPASRRAETDEPELQSSDEPGNPAPEEEAEPVSRSSRSFALQREKRALSL